MIPLKIGLIEDENFIAKKTENDLRNIGYSIATVVSHFKEAIKMISEENPDLIVIDINFNGEEKGLEMAHMIRKIFGLPIIFIAARCDQITIEKAIEVKPIGYLVKPLSKANLYAGIEIAISNYRSNSKQTDRSILVKDGYIYVQVQLNHILYIHSIRNYVILHLNIHRKIMVRSTLAEMLDRLPQGDFLRINRSVIMNVHHVTKIEKVRVSVDGNSFMITKIQREELLRLLVGK